MAYLNYYWRLLATGLSFTLFGLGGLVLSLTVFPLINIAVSDVERRASLSQGLVHRSFRLFTWFMAACGVIKVEVQNAERLAHERGALIVANHPSLIDVVLIISLMDRAQCIVKHEVWRNPFMRGVVTATRYIKNDDDPEKLINDCTETLKNGNNLVIFPEGSRTVPGRSRKLRRGVANIALRAGAPIRPVTITCVPPTLKKGEKWYQIPPRRVLYTLEVQERIDMEPFIGEARLSVASRRLTEHLANIFEGILENGEFGKSDSASYRRSAQS